MIVKAILLSLSLVCIATAQDVTPPAPKPTEKATFEFLDGDRFWHHDVANLLCLRFAWAAHPAVFLFAGTLERGERTRARAIATHEPRNVLLHRP